MNPDLAVVKTEAEVLISASGINQTWGNRHVLQNIDLAISENEIVTIIGPNGCGKSSLLRILLGLNTPDSGKVTRRKGLRIGGLANAGEAPWYVVDKDLKRNVLIVGQGHNHPRLFSKGLVANQLHLVDRIELTAPIACTVKTRYRQEDVACNLSPMANGEYLVMFTEPQSSVTPGQSVVFYQDNICLGGGIINSLIR